ALFSNLESSRAVGVLNDDVSTLVDEGAGSVSFLGRIVPAREPDDVDGDLRVDLAGSERESVDAHHHFRDRERADVTDSVGLREMTGKGAHDGAAFVETGIVG